MTKLALIGVDGITSGPPGGTLTFTGLDLLALGTVNGSINLTSDISFQDISVLAMYARGAGSNLILDSPISNIGDLKLGAEGSIQLTNPGTMNVGQFDATAGNDLTLQIGGSLLLNGKVRLDAIVLPGTTVANGANLAVNVTGDYTNSSASELSRFNVENSGGHIGTGGNLLVNIGGNFTTAFDTEFVIDNVNGTISNGGDLLLTVAGDSHVSGDASFQILNNDGGHLGGHANIEVVTGGAFSADTIDALINNRNAGSISFGSDMIFHVGGALTTTGDASFITSNRNDGAGGGTIGADVFVILQCRERFYRRIS